MSDQLRAKALKGVAWSAIDRFSSQGVQFVFSILIARMLLPKDYGIVAMLDIFLAISRTFIDSGFCTALIRKTDRTESDFSTVFYFNVFISIVLYLILWFISPIIAEFYDIPLLERITKIIALTLIFGALSAVQGVHLSIKIDVKSRALISICTTITTGIVGLWLAYSGYGVWALVAQSVISSTMRCLLMWIVVRWMPRLIFSWSSFKNLFGFGSKLLISSLVDTIYNNVYTLVIGKVFTANSLGVYSKASSLANYPSSNITNVLHSVMFPVLSSIQNDLSRLRSAYIKFLRLSAFVVFPLMIGLASLADPVIRFLLTDKWIGAVPFLRMISFALMWYPIHSINLNILQVTGRSDYFLRVEIFKKILGVIILCITIPYGLYAMCLGRIITSIFCLPINTYYTKKIIGYGLVDQIKDLWPLFVHSIIMGLVSYGASSIIDSLYLKVIVGVSIGALYYFIIAYVAKFPEMNELLAILKLKRR